MCFKILGVFNVVCVCVLCDPRLCCVIKIFGGFLHNALEGVFKIRWTPPPTPRVDRPPFWTVQNLSASIPSRVHFFFWVSGDVLGSFFLSQGVMSWVLSMEVFSWNFGSCFGRLGPLMCLFSQLFCETPAACRSQKRMKMGAGEGK